ncbi:MAG: 50S ribosomal protein L22 [Verrucomicrobia bacterium]|nr:50S ribosomal protein L22 [Verrucomicrobiota bacterium]
MAHEESAWHEQEFGMDVTAITKFVRLSSTKARDLARRIQGMSVAEALKVVDFSERKGATVLGKTLKSAIANAENNSTLSAYDLVVKLAVVDQGPSTRRYWSRARGMVRPIMRRSSHVRVILSDGKEPVSEEE